MKGGKVNPAEEFFYKLSLKRDFREDIARARIRLGIPNAGMSAAEAKEWLERQDILLLTGIEMELKETYQIPVPYFTHIGDYILLERPRENSGQKKPPVAFLEELADSQIHLVETAVSLIVKCSLAFERAHNDQIKVPTRSNAV